ncbi:Protein srek1IP1 [Borealophlyctis nickersoniae]|nr:Protein srek1IP1 [Borealophlyctis nickersoniae]
MASATAVKVANLSSLVTEEILKELFSILGPVTDLQLYPSPHGDGQESVIEFGDAMAAITALHLTGTELGDRTLFVTNVANPAIMRPKSPATVAGISSRNPNINPTILHFDPAKAEEISRTIYIGNISTLVSEEKLTEIFAACGPVAYVKMAGDPSQQSRFAFMEFATQEAATEALNLNGMTIGDRALKVNHSKNAINKAPKKPDMQQDAAMRRVREAQMRIANKYGEPGETESPGRDRRRDSRSPSRSSYEETDLDLEKDGDLGIAITGDVHVLGITEGLHLGLGLDLGLGPATEEETTVLESTGETTETGEDREIGGARGRVKIVTEGESGGGTRRIETTTGKRAGETRNAAKEMDRERERDRDGRRSEKEREKDGSGRYTDDDDRPVRDRSHSSKDKRLAKKQTEDEDSDAREMDEETVGGQSDGYEDERKDYKRKSSDVDEEKTPRRRRRERT